MMDNRGKHVASGSSAFIRDLIVMAVGIVIVGVLLYGGLSIFAGLGGDEDPDAAGSTVTTATTAPSSTNTTIATTAPTTTTTTAATTTTSEAIVVRPPSEVTVLVLNSTGRSGIAATLSTALGQAGYGTLQADNYEPGLDQSRVWYLGDFGPEAAELQAEFVPDAAVEPYEGPDLGADIVVVLGAGFEG
ncbi:MAG TPA: LytR C-terminal domain-containing protein [Acidimicrobiia bacterium]|nr:LytR C-terminal domain-containing protein [Acidimicrobiia bacterium]